MKKVVILYSGGLDSFILYKYIKSTQPDAEVKCIYYVHGADSEQSEMSRLPHFVERKWIDWLDDRNKPLAKDSDPFAGAIYIPGRNLVFSVMAACQELANEIVMGTVWDEDNPGATDKNELFREATSALLTYVLSPFINKVTVRFPFVENEWTKNDCVKWALENDVTPDELMFTISCWNHKGVACGQCKQCFKRWLVFKLNGFEEHYAQHPIDSDFGRDLIKQYLDSYIQGNSNRDEETVARNILGCYRKTLFPWRVMDFIRVNLCDTKYEDEIWLFSDVTETMPFDWEKKTK